MGRIMEKHHQLQIEYPNEIKKSDDEQLYHQAFEFNKLRFPQEHADVMDKYFLQLEENNTRYAQWVLDSWVFNLITVTGERLDGR